ncbi:hypothetical protein GCM10009812_33780 [Nocardioides marinus]
MWIEDGFITVAVGKPMALPSPKAPKRSAVRVPGTISPTLSSHAHRACTAGPRTRLVREVTVGG